MKPSAVSQHPVAQIVSILLVALIPVSIGVYLLADRISYVPSLSQLQVVSGRIELVQTVKFQTGSDSEIVLDNSPVKLRHTSDGARYDRLATSLRKGDLIAAWVERQREGQGQTLQIWQLQKGSQLIVPFSEQAEVEDIKNSLIQAAAGACFVSSPFLAWYLNYLTNRRRRRWEVRRLRREGILVDQDVQQQKGRVVLAKAGGPLAILCSIAVIWWIASKVGRAAELGAFHLVLNVGAAQAALIIFPVGATYRSAHNRLVSYGRILDGTVWISIVLMVILVPLYDVLYYLPASALMPVVGGEIVPWLGPLLPVLSGPSASTLVLATAVLCPNSAASKRVMIIGICLASTGATLFRATTPPTLPELFPWLLVGEALAVWCSYVAFRLSARIGVQNSTMHTETVQ